MDALLFEIVLWTKDSKTSIMFGCWDLAIEREADHEIVYYWQLSLCAVWTWFALRNPWKGAKDTEELPF